MRLRGRFGVGFALAALIPIGAAAFGTRDLVSSNYETAFERERERAVGLARDALGDLERDVARVVESQAQRDTHYVGGVLIDLASYGALPERTLDRVAEEGRPLMKSLAFDVLVLVDGGDRVLDAPHYRPAVGELDPARRTIAREHGGAAFYAREPVLEADRIVSRVVTEAARTARDGGHEVTVCGGRAVDARVLEAARRDDAVDARIVAADGEILVPSTRAWRVGAVDRLPLNGADGRPIAWVEVAVSRARLDALLADVSRLSALLAGSALIVAILLGVVVSRRMTRDLDALVEGALAAARGDLDHQVPVRTADEIGAVADAMNTMMADLKDSKERLVMAERIAAWQEIARRLAHEIKNPLTPIQMSIETLRKTFAKKHPSFDEIFEESTQTVLEEAGRLKRIVSEFSEFARMPKPEKRVVTVDEVVVGVLALYQGGALPIERALAGDLPALEADPDALHQALLNLVENARDAMAGLVEGERRLRVSTAATRGGKAVAIAVEDSGPGIAAELRERIFTPYYTTKHAHGGTGLGLAIVHRTVSDHGGRITVGESTLGGARFVVELPLAGADLAASVVRPR